MAENPPNPKNSRQLSIKEYAKIKGKTAKSKIKITFPWVIKVCFIVPAIYCMFLIIYYLVHLRFLAEH